MQYAWASTHTHTSTQSIHRHTTPTENRNGSCHFLYPSVSKQWLPVISLSTLPSAPFNHGQFCSQRDHCEENVVMLLFGANSPCLSVTLNMTPRAVSSTYEVLHALACTWLHGHGEPSSSTNTWQHFWLCFSPEQQSD